MFTFLARQATKPDTRTAAEKRAQARDALEEAEKLLHQVAGGLAFSQDGAPSRLRSVA
jgi:hypothetical protein